jgi:hypothetical protein
VGTGVRGDGRTSGPGNIGSLPSSRLTRILQEKAEALKKKRQSAEQAQKDAEDQIAHLERLGLLPAEAPERARRMRELARRSDWEAVESEAKSLLDYVSRAAPASLETRRLQTVASVDRLSGSGVAIPAGLRAELEALAKPSEGVAWGDLVARLVRVEDGLRDAETEYVRAARNRALEVARWAGLTGEALAAFDRRLEEAARPALEGRLAESVDAIAHLVRTGIPEAVRRREKARDEAERLTLAAKEQSVPTGRLDAALRADADADPVRWPETVPGIEVATTEVGETLRERSGQILDALRTTLGASAEFGAETREALLAVEEAIAKLPGVAPLEITPLVGEARRAAEEPIVAVVASLLDEVRPRITEARRLGRDPSEVFAAMNRAREALRLKIYSEALAASQEAYDRAGRLTEDLETVEEEVAALEEMLRRFQSTGFAIEPYAAAVQRARAQLERADVAGARAGLREIVLQVGREALQFFVQRWTALEKVREYAKDRGFLSEGAGAAMASARELIDKGNFAAGAEEIARAELELRRAAVPYMGRRIEEMEQGFADIPDEALTAPVRRSLADADVTLRVKGDVVTAIESLKRAERDFASVFATHASSLVEMLETEGRTLEAMGGASDEIQRQIDEVQQIFNMGDFVKASRASQEIRTRAQQQQLVRSEEAVSHAKLSLVELETMGLDLSKFRAQLDEAQSAARAQRYADAYRLATKLEESASRTRAEAQAVLELLSRAQERLVHLRDTGIDPGPFYEPIRNVRLAFQSLDFDAARVEAEQVIAKLAEAGARVETDRSLGDIERLIEDGRRLASPMEPFALRLQKLKTEHATAASEATLTGARLLHEELLALIRPVLEENLRGLERDLDIARSAGVDVDKILGPLGEARRRIALPLPIGAASLLDTARSELIATRGFVEHSERIAKRAREALAEADLLHVEVGPLRAEVERVDEALAQRQYSRAIELGSPLERELLQATYQHVSKTLAHFQATVTRLHREGAATTVAENLLHQARMALDEGHAVEALQLASRSEGELERADLQRRLAEGSLEAAERSISRALAEGTVAPVAAQEFEAAQAAFQRREYADVLERAIAASDALGAARDGHRRARDALAAAERQAAEAAGMGADVAEASARLGEGRASLERGQYSEAVRAGREAVEMGRWSIERLFARPLGELKRLIDFARKEGLGAEIDHVEAVVGQAEAALRAREWGQVREAIDRAELSSRRAFEAIVDGRAREVEAEYGRAGAPIGAEQARREETRRQLAQLRQRHEYADALQLLRSELELARRQRREALEARAADLKDRLWLGERLGVDTTPMMQTFSEARTSLDGGHYGEAETQLARAFDALQPAVAEPLARRLKDLQTEITFAQEGLHVSVGSVRDLLRTIDELVRDGHPLDGARELLRAEEELALRKSLHRELMNLHYLIDAALARAHERHLDTTVARQLLAESIRLREQDYPAALLKAREALRKLQEEGAGAPEATAPPTPAPAANPLWPFRRPPTEP